MLRLATRSSDLAMWQARRVAELLQEARPGTDVELVPVSTAGDRKADVPVWEMGGRGVFVAEVQAAVLAGEADAAVHSAKDLQPVTGEDLCLAAVPEREDPRDAMVGSLLADLPFGATVATGSQRRRAQLASMRPDLHFESLRGNIGTRLEKIPPGGAIVVAHAALQRLGLYPQPLDVLPVAVMVPQVGQGAIAVECRAGDREVMELLAAVDNQAERGPVSCERSFLARIGGACDLPVGGYARTGPGGDLHMEGLLASPDGGVVVRRAADGPPEAPEELGRQVAQMVLDAGGRALLETRPG